MTYFLRNGTAYTPTAESALDLHKVLPPGNYIVKATPQGQLYFDGIDSFSHEGKIYGDITRYRDRIMSTFDAREMSTGVMLNGEKGSGKTLLARLLSMSGAELGIPTIVINAAWRGDAFNQLIQDIEQPAIILFDEFEKVYDSDEQQEMLTLLDGVFPSKKLFVLTCNNKYRVDSHMRNRPGRIFYMMDFNGLDAAFITEYCEERLNDKQHIPTICRLAALFESFNFDILKALVEEMNRYRETPHQVLEILNAKPFSENSGKHDIKMYFKGKEVPLPKCHPNSYNANPVSQQEIELYHYVPAPTKDDEDNEDTNHIQLRPTDLKHIDPTEGTYTYMKDDYKVVFTKVKHEPYNWMNAI